MNDSTYTADASQPKFEPAFPHMVMFTIPGQSTYPPENRRLRVFEQFLLDGESDLIFTQVHNIATLITLCELEDWYVTDDCDEGNHLDEDAFEPAVTTHKCTQMRIDGNERGDESKQSDMPFKPPLSRLSEDVDTNTAKIRCDDTSSGDLIRLMGTGRVLSDNRHTSQRWGPPLAQIGVCGFFYIAYLLGIRPA